MGVHIAQIGTGRVGRATAYTIMCSGLASRLTVCDIKPGLAEAFAEELLHAAVSYGIDIEVSGCGRDEDVQGADIILVSAGEPRIPGVEMSRRDLVVKNARVMKDVAEAIAPKNPHAKYIVITNPVDAMAMVFKKYSSSDFVISTGANLESLRFRSKLARIINTPASKVIGWAGGEHGDAAIILWSTVKVNGVPFKKYISSEKTSFNKSETESYMKKISKFIIDSIGGTEYGPAASFRDIVRAIIKNTNETLAIAVPWKFEEIPEKVNVSVPLMLGNSIGLTLFETLLEEEKKGIKNAAKVIYDTYMTALEGLIK